MTTTDSSLDELPRWSVADVHESLESRSFLASMEQAGGRRRPPRRRCSTSLGVRAVEPRTRDRRRRPRRRRGDRGLQRRGRPSSSCWRRTSTPRSAPTASTSRRRRCSASSIRSMAGLKPLLARLADWVHALGADGAGPTRSRRSVKPPASTAGRCCRLAARAAHQMSELEEGLYAELGTVGSSAWGRLQSDVTSQLTAEVVVPRRHAPSACRCRPCAGWPPHADPAVRRAAYDAELRGLAEVAVAVRRRDERDQGRGQHRQPPPQLGRARSTPRCSPTASAGPTFDAMQAAVRDVAPRLPPLDAGQGPPARPRRRAAVVGPRRPAAGRAGRADAGTTGSTSSATRSASYSPQLGGLVDRALDERWIDAAPRDGKRGGAFCMPFVGDRSLVLLNWSGSADSAQTTAHELGHAYHNTTLADRTPLQRRLPMALAETASIFCETLVVEAGLARLDGRRAPGPARRRPAVGANQVVVDIHSRFLFETEVFARRQRRTLGVSRARRADGRRPGATRTATGSTSRPRHPYMWAAQAALLRLALLQLAVHLRPAVRARAVRPVPGRPRAVPRRLRRRCCRVPGWTPPRSSAQAFGLDVTDEAFWTASLDVLRGRIADYDAARRRRSSVTAPSRPATTSTATSSPSCSPASRATASTRCGTGCTSSSPTPDEMTNLPKALRARLAAELPLALDAGHRVGERRRRHREVPLGARRRQPRSRPC